jgi:hypothetical protein
MHFTASMHVQVYKLDSEIKEHDFIVGLNHCSSLYGGKQHGCALAWYSLPELID